MKTASIRAHPWHPWSKNCLSFDAAAAFINWRFDCLSGSNGFVLRRCGREISSAKILHVTPGCFGEVIFDRRSIPAVSNRRRNAVESTCVASIPPKGGDSRHGDGFQNCNA